MYNQHFNKKNFEAAIRVALITPNTYIKVNGDRSRTKYNVFYRKFTNTVEISKLISETPLREHELVSAFNIESPMMQQLSVDTWINKVVDIISENIAA